MTTHPPAETTTASMLLAGQAYSAGAFLFHKTSERCSTAVSTPKNRPFKKFFCDRPEVFLLPPAAFKIWMYHYSREGVARKSWPSIKTLCETLDMDRHSVCKWRSWLTVYGWLERIGERQGSGKFCVPVFKVKRGSIPAKNLDGRALNRVRKLNTQFGVKTSHVDRCENITLEVDSEKQVDEISVRRNERTRNLRTSKSVSPSGSPLAPLENAGLGDSCSSSSSDGEKISAFGKTPRGQCSLALKRGQKFVSESQFWEMGED
jgi:hypothetical protein